MLAAPAETSLLDGGGPAAPEDWCHAVGTQPFHRKDVWTAQADLSADAEDVLLALTDPDLIATWAPVQFAVDGLAGGRLRAGCRERVAVRSPA